MNSSEQQTLAPSIDIDPVLAFGQTNISSSPEQLFRDRLPDVTWAEEELLENQEESLTSKATFLGYVLKSTQELYFLRFLLKSFIVNNLRRRYQRSVLGFVWSLLSPLLLMLVTTGVFSLLFQRDPRTYGIYLLTGMLPWQFMSDSVAASCLSIIGGEHFMKKIYFPKLFFPLLTVATESINFSLSLCSMILLTLLFGLKLQWTLVFLPLVLAVTFLYTLGLSLLSGVATVYFRDFAHILRVVLSSVFYITPIIYPLNLIPSRYEWLFRCNPFYYFIDLYRQIIYYGRLPKPEVIFTSLALALMSVLLGLFLMMRKEKDIIFRL
jgi:ABC-type polysaccharide/polyol phosphate export permease